MFKDKVLLITGGTGSFGNAVLSRFLQSDFAEIRIFSRDEKKQEDMRIALKSDKVKFYIGDVRDYDGFERCWLVWDIRPDDSGGNAVVEAAPEPVPT